MDNNMMEFIKSITNYGDATILHLYQTWLNRQSSTPKEPEAVHGNEAEREVLNDFISEIEKEFSDQNWEYLHFIAERVLKNRSK